MNRRSGTVITLEHGVGCDSGFAEAVLMAWCGVIDGNTHGRYRLRLRYSCSCVCVASASWLIEECSNLNFLWCVRMTSSMFFHVSPILSCSHFDGVYGMSAHA